MKTFTRTVSLFLAASAIYLTASTASARVDVSIGINVPPPVVQHVEVTPPQRHGYVWAPGYWHWEGHRHIWTEGRWIKARRGHVWAPARWESRGDRHHFVPGRWERDHHGRPSNGHGHGHERGHRDRH